jgi:branched-chain amino acid transport system permease protein
MNASLEPRRAVEWWPWAAYALCWCVAPWVLGSGPGLNLLTQIGFMVIICLSFNLLLGEGGMLSFGHAVYSGIGAYAVIHALNAASQGQLGVPVALMPLLGGLGSALLAAVLGWPSTRKGGTAFAMITLGVGELVFALSHTLPGLFGGEGGVSANRVVGEGWLGLHWRSAEQVYGLVAVYAFVCTLALWSFTATPLGRLLNAVRDNPDRVAFIGYNPHTVRYRVFVLAAFFAGVGGGLAAIHFENVTPESLGSLRSGSILLFTVLGGTALFAGPVIGAMLMVLAFTVLADVSRAWQVYVGVAFMAVVLKAPGGLASLLWRLPAGGPGAASVPTAPLAWRPAVAMLPFLVGCAALMEMVYHRQLDAALDPRVQFMGVSLDTHSTVDWAIVTVLTLLCAVAAGAWRVRGLPRGAAAAVAPPAGPPEP